MNQRILMPFVIATGIAIGTLFTLFILPAVYMLFAAKHRPEEVRAEIGGVPVLQGAT